MDGIFELIIIGVGVVVMTILLFIDNIIGWIKRGGKK